MNKRGITLTELMISMGILGLLVSMLGLFVFARKTGTNTSRQVAELHELWRAVAGLEQDLQNVLLDPDFIQDDFDATFNSLFGR